MKNTTSHPPDLSITRRAISSERGLATLEFVFALPMLLLLMVGMTWLGVSVLRQAEVTVVARHQAWVKRFDNSAAQAFVFASHPRYRVEDEFVSGESTQSVNVSQVYAGGPAPAATHAVIAGTWDHQSLPLDDLPNWNAYGLAVVNAGTGDLQNLVGSLDHFRDAIADVGSQFLANQLGLSNVLGNVSSQANTTQQGQANQQQAQRLAEKIQLQQRQRELESEIDELEEKERRRGALTETEQRKLFRLKSELGDVKEELRELRNLGI